MAILSHFPPFHPISFHPHLLENFILFQLLFNFLLFSHLLLLSFLLLFLPFLPSSPNVFPRAQFFALGSNFPL